MPLVLAIYVEPETPLERGYSFTFAPSYWLFLFGLQEYILVWGGFFHARWLRYGSNCDVGGMTMHHDLLWSRIAVGELVAKRCGYPRTCRIFPAGQEFLPIIYDFGFVLFFVTTNGVFPFLQIFALSQRNPFSICRSSLFNPEILTTPLGLSQGTSPSHCGSKIVTLISLINLPVPDSSFRACGFGTWFCCI